MKTRIIIIGLATLGILASCQTHKANPVSVPDPVIQAFKAEKGTLTTTTNLPGELRPYQTVDLFAKVNGFVKTMYADLGSQVKKGQLLMTLEAPEMTAALKQAQEDLHTKEAIYKGSKATYDRLLKTSKMPGTISPNDLDMAHAKMSADSATLLAAKSAYQLSADLRNYLEVRAPFDGVISARNVYAGAYVAPSDKNTGKPMLTLQQQTRLRLAISVPEAATGYFKNKDTVSFSVKTLPGKIFKGIVSRLSGSMNQELRSEDIEMDVANNSKELLPGMFAQVTLQLTNAQKTFLVPPGAIAQNSQRVFVIRVVNNKAEWVDVQKGRYTPNNVEVYGNLNEGDILIQNATDELKAGTPIKSLNVTTPAAN